MPKNITLADVAERVGVSMRTVSRVVNQEPGFSEGTRRRVQEAIEELEYRPNLMARGLVTRRSCVIGLVVTDITNPFFPSIAEGVQRAAALHGQTLVLANTHEDPEEQLAVLGSLMSHAADGVVLFPVRGTETQLISFADRGLPLVVANVEIDHPLVGVVSSRLRAGARRAVDHLMTAGHGHIGMVGNVNEVNGRREQGFKDGLKAHRIAVHSAPIVRALPNADGGHKAAMELLQANPKVTAIFAYNDLMAIGVLRACRDLGRRVPDDCAVLGFDDIELAAEVTPSLTTIRIDRAELGRAAVDLLISMISEPGEVQAGVDLEVELVVRESA